VNVNSHVPCGQGKTRLVIFIYVIPAKCGIKARNFLLFYPLYENGSCIPKNLNIGVGRPVTVIFLFTFAGDSTPISSD
jgi:hypothetical protein